MALYTDFNKGIADNTITFNNAYELVEADSWDEVNGTFNELENGVLRPADVTLSFRIAGGLKKSSTFLPVQGAEDPLENARQLAKLINPLTVCQVNSIRCLVLQSNDNDIPARPLGSFPTKNFRWRVYRADGLKYEDVVISVPYFRGASTGTDGAVTAASAMTPYIKVFGPDDVAHFLG